MPAIRNAARCCREMVMFQNDVPRDEFWARYPARQPPMKIQAFFKEFPWIERHRITPESTRCVHVVRADSTLLRYGPITRETARSLEGPVVLNEELLLLLDKEGNVIERHCKKNVKRWPWSRKTVVISYTERSAVGQNETMGEVLERLGPDAEKIHYALSCLLGSVIVYLPRGGRSILEAIRQEEERERKGLQKEIEKINAA